jgi:nuclear transport factor 2 (NTF2) superfamily protein
MIHPPTEPEETNMAAHPLRQQGNGNPRTLEEARALVKHVEQLFMPWDVEALVDGFTPDCVVRFGCVLLEGRAALRAFFMARSSRQQRYRLRKELRTFVGETLTNTWEGEWEDAETGVAMRGFGVELWILREGRIAVWEAAFNVGRADRPSGVADMLS